MALLQFFTYIKFQKGKISLSKHFYEIHISLGKNDGYSYYFESDNFLGKKEDIIKEAILNSPDLKNDIEGCDYVIEITEEAYRKATD